MTEVEKKARDERQLEVLRHLAERLTDGIGSKELSEILQMHELTAAVLLSRLKKQGIVLKKKSGATCRYCISSKGERKLAWLEASKVE